MDIVDDPLNVLRAGLLFIISNRKTPLIVLLPVFGTNGLIENFLLRLKYVISQNLHVAIFYHKKISSLMAIGYFKNKQDMNSFGKSVCQICSQFSQFLFSKQQLEGYNHNCILHLVKNLEMCFFSLKPSMQILQHFKNLVSLSLVQQNINEIKGLEGFCNLEKLWLCEMNIETISGLDDCINLVELNLYSNRISKIGGLSSLIKLKSLNLSDNGFPCFNI